MCIFSAVCTSKARLDGKTAVITGANTGIGKYTTQDFYTRGARVIVACRNLEKANQAVADIKQTCKDLVNLGTLVIVQMDLTSLNSVRKCAEKLLSSERRIDLLINNAGVMMCPESKTEDGFEMQIGTNHLGHFLFTMLLLPKICHSTPARIVNVSSVLHAMGGRIDLEDLNWERKRYSSIRSYQQSKLANILFTKELARRLKENGISGVRTYVLHPGVIRTELSRHIESSYWIIGWLTRNVSQWVIKTPRQGAQTTIYCAVDEECAHQTGLYYGECAVKQPSRAARNEEDGSGLIYFLLARWFLWPVRVSQGCKTNTHLTAIKGWNYVAGVPETEEQQKLRFQVELEFVQCLGNPNYLNFLAQRGYFKDSTFVNYLKYLLYWKEPDYAKYLKYPMCLYFLDLLQYEHFRRELVNAQCSKFIDDQQILLWQHYTRRRSRLLTTPTVNGNMDPGINQGSSHQANGHLNSKIS